MDAPHYYYDLESKETYVFTRPDHEYNTHASFGEWVFFRAHEEASTSDSVMMKRDDYIAGETDCIYLRSEKANPGQIEIYE